MKKASLAFLKGLLAGGLIHSTAWAAAWTLEEVAHFVGHVIAMMGVELLRRYQAF